MHFLGKHFVQKRKEDFFKKIWKKDLNKTFLDLNLYQAKSGVISFWEGRRSGVKNSKVTQKGLKHILVLEFLKSDEIFKIL